MYVITSDNERVWVPLGELVWASGIERAVIEDLYFFFQGIENVRLSKQKSTELPTRKKCIFTYTNSKYTRKKKPPPFLRVIKINVARLVQTTRG